MSHGSKQYILQESPEPPDRRLKPFFTPLLTHPAVMTKLAIPLKHLKNFVWFFGWQNFIKKEDY